MKFEILRLLFYILFLSSVCAEYHRNLFESWKSAYNKNYDTQDEEEFRYRTWKDNLRIVTDHNLEYANRRQLYRLEMNNLADMNGSEVSSVLTGYGKHSSKKDDPKKKPPAARYLGLMNIPEEVLPAHVDWRDKGLVTRVRYQGHCGSCYAFSATGALEAQHKRKTGKLIELSQQNLVDCSHDEGDNGCHGGLMDKSFRYIIRNEGIDTYDSYPYEAHKGPCRYKHENLGAIQVGYVDIPKGNERLLKEAVATVGPISTAMASKSEHFHLYAYGVYFQHHCEKKHMSHGILIVGYGTTDDGIDYWIIKNSWGAWWGEGGYFRLARNMDNMCGVATEASFPLV